MSLTLKKSSSEFEPQPLVEKKKLQLFIAGIGAVGGTLLHLINDLQNPGFELTVIGICNSKFTQWNPDTDALKDISSLAGGEPTDWDLIPNELVRRNQPRFCRCNRQ